MLAISDLETLALHAAAEIQNGKKGSSKAEKSRKSSLPPPVTKSRKGRRGSRVNKGLRHFSVKVCEKLSQTGVTTYNEIANLLVNEAKPQLESGKGGGYDEKNIRRRIYDALNVLMAMDIITKDKKKIRWKGIKTSPPNSLEKMQTLKSQADERIAKKKILLEEMTYEYLARKHLLERNAKPEAIHHKDKLHRPFIIVNSRSTNDITCEMTDDRTQVFFNYSDSFSINDDHVILKEIGMQTAPELVPTELRRFLPSRFPHTGRKNPHPFHSDLKSAANLELDERVHPSYRRSTSSTLSENENDSDDEEDEMSPDIGTPSTASSSKKKMPDLEKLDKEIIASSLDVAGNSTFDDQTLEIPLPLPSPLKSPVSPPLSSPSQDSLPLTPSVTTAKPLGDSSVISLLPTVLNPSWSASNSGLAYLSLPPLPPGLSQASPDWSSWPWTLSEWPSGTCGITATSASTPPALVSQDLSVPVSDSSLSSLSSLSLSSLSSLSSLNTNSLLFSDFLNSSPSWSVPGKRMSDCSQTDAMSGTDAMSAALSLSYLLSNSSSESIPTSIPLLESSSSFSSLPFPSSSFPPCNLHTSAPLISDLALVSSKNSVSKKKRPRSKPHSKKRSGPAKNKRVKVKAPPDLIPKKEIDPLRSLAELAGVSV